MTDRILKLDDIVEITGASVSTIKRWEKAGKFPARKKLGIKAMGWLASDIQRWLENLPSVKHHKGAA
ncbi:helix-turn-helix transcriptional regulator [Pseudoalteromonas sp. SCQQ13]|uniref:helix-turn-helix transcriptional regulator n=1 Tax=Pseudoalteromonas sp. SCQQ13 TaxID=2792066 RepID=UPI0018CE1508|nr:AlpA family phage regulatory protein [Pseudoalteromonas sp. SCQQ13]MBH0092850.1 AlpA family phage regulatory protein [Pseudoalteromonas sp. SCQQ13]